MKISRKKKEMNDIEKIKNFLAGLGFVCQSQPSSQNLIYSKKGDIIIIRNKTIRNNMEVDMK